MSWLRRFQRKALCHPQLRDFIHRRGASVHHAGRSQRPFRQRHRILEQRQRLSCGKQPHLGDLRRGVDEPRPCKQARRPKRRAEHHLPQQHRVACGILLRILEQSGILHHGKHSGGEQYICRCGLWMGPCATARSERRPYHGLCQQGADQEFRLPQQHLLQQHGSLPAHFQ